MVWTRCGRCDLVRRHSTIVHYSSLFTSFLLMMMDGLWLSESWLAEREGVEAPVDKMVGEEDR